MTNTFRPSTSKSTRVYVKNASDVPKQKHWAILYNEMVMAAGYDKDDPPERIPVPQYVAYTDQAEWEEEVKRRAIAPGSGTPSFIALVVDVPTVTTTVEVTIK